MGGRKKMAKMAEQEKRKRHRNSVKGREHFGMSEWLWNIQYMVIDLWQGDEQVEKRKGKEEPERICAGMHGCPSS